MNKAAKEQYQKEYYLKNKEKLKAASQKRRIETPESQRLYAAKYRLKNRDLCNERTKRSMEKKPEFYRQARLKFYEANKHAWYKRPRYRESRYLYLDPCSYCGQKSTQIDHIVAKAKGGSDEWTNLTSACERCNNSKKVQSLLLFLLDTNGNGSRT